MVPIGQAEEQGKGDTQVSLLVPWCILQKITLQKQVLVVFFHDLQTDQWA